MSPHRCHDLALSSHPHTHMRYMYWHCSCRVHASEATLPCPQQLVALCQARGSVVRLILTDRQFPVYPDVHTTSSEHQLASTYSTTHTQTHSCSFACLTLSQTMNHCIDASLADRSRLALPPPFMATQSSFPGCCQPRLEHM